MAKSIPALVNPELLIWARESARLTPDEAAKALPGKEGNHIEAWESGEGAPTIAQLRKLANKYKRPLSVFFLPEPPKDFQALRDFRRFPGEVSGTQSPELASEIRAIQERRQLALDLFDELSEQPPTFQLDTSQTRDPDALAREIRTLLGIDIRTQKTWRDPRIAYNAWRDHIEAKGVLVFQASRVALAEMRGFAIAEDVLPVIAVNAKDSYNARTFSLLHEFCHLAIRQSGISDFSGFTEEDTRPAEEQQIEVFCNSVAANVLMPEGDFLAHPIVEASRTVTNWSDAYLTELARSFGVSPEAVLRRLLTLGRTTQEFYNAKRQQYLKAYQEAANKKQSGGPQKHHEALGRLGTAFSHLVLQSYYNKRITLNDVSGYLGLKVHHIPNFETAAHRRMAS